MKYVTIFKKLLPFIPICLALIALSGWIFHIEPLRSLSPGNIGMNPIVAILLISISIATFFIHKNNTIPISTGLIVIAVSINRILDTLNPSYNDLDTLLFYEKVMATNRMAHTTAFCLMCMGVSLIVISLNNPLKKIAPYLLAVIAMISLSALLGYLYNVRVLYGLSWFTPMALPTALSIFFGQYAILSRIPYNNLFEILEADTIGGEVSRRLLPFCVIVPAFLGWLRLKIQHYGLLPNETAIAVFTMLMMVGYFIIVRIITTRLHKNDIARIEAVEKERQQAKEIKAQNDLMISNLNLAKQIQKSLLPSSLVQLVNNKRLSIHSRYEPADDLGGDFYAFIKLSDTKVGIFVGDIMGHGVRSALLTTMMFGLIEELGQEAHDPGVFLSSLNKSFTSILQRSDISIFATAIYMVIDTYEHNISYASAGHPYPIYANKKTKEVKFLNEENDPAIGVLEDCNYITRYKKLDDSDSIVIYTDGLSEASPQDHSIGSDLIGYVKSNLHLSGAKLIDKLLNLSIISSPNCKLEDDVCIVVIDLDKIKEGKTL